MHELTCSIKPRLKIASESIIQSILPFPRDISTDNQSSVQVKYKEHTHISQYTDTR
jgi:hypothetical protein